MALDDEIKEIILRKIGNEVAEDIRNQAKINCPVVTGNLRASIKSGYIFETNTIWIGSNVEYAAHVEYGTKAHVIKRKINWKTAKKTLKQVMHPGFKGRFYIHRAIETVLNEL